MLHAHCGRRCDGSSSWSMMVRSSARQASCPASFPGNIEGGSRASSSPQCSLNGSAYMSKRRDGGQVHFCFEQRQCGSSGGSVWSGAWLGGWSSIASLSTHLGDGHVCIGGEDRKKGVCSVRNPKLPQRKANYQIPVVEIRSVDALLHRQVQYFPLRSRVLCLRRRRHGVSSSARWSVAERRPHGLDGKTTKILGHPNGAGSAPGTKRVLRR